MINLLDLSIVFLMLIFTCWATELRGHEIFVEDNNSTLRLITLEEVKIDGIVYLINNEYYIFIEKG